MTTYRGVLAFALVAIVAAGSAAADPPATTSTSAAPEQTAAAPSKRHDVDPNALICKREERTDTMFAEKVCLTAAQWDQNRQNDVDAVRRISATPQSPGEGGLMMGR